MTEIKWEYAQNVEPLEHVVLADEHQLLHEQNLELARQVSELQLSQDNIINGLGIKGDGPYSKLVLEKFISLQAKCDALAAENAALNKFCKDASFDADYEAELGMGRGGFSDALDDIKTPATDAAIAEIKARGVDEFVSELAGKIRLAGGEDGYSLVNYGEYADHLESKGEDFAANLRAGRKG